MFEIGAVFSDIWRDRLVNKPPLSWALKVTVLLALSNHPNHTLDFIFYWPLLGSVMSQRHNITKTMSTTSGFQIRCLRKKIKETLWMAITGAGASLWFVLLTDGICSDMGWSSTGIPCRYHPFENWPRQNALTALFQGRVCLVGGKLSTYHLTCWSLRKVEDTICLTFWPICSRAYVSWYLSLHV